MGSARFVGMKFRAFGNNMFSVGMKKRIITAIFATGFSGIVAQILLLRELLITFCGNELSIGIILANWLILESAGAFLLGKRIEKFKYKIEIFAGFILLFSLSLPLAVYVARIFKEIIGVAAGEGLGLLPIFYSSLFILLPVSLSHGALFTFGCKVYSLHSKENASSIGQVYIYETLGTIAGGIVFTYLFILFFNSVEIAFGLALLNLIMCVFLLGFFWRGKESLFRKAVGVFSAIAMVLFGYIIFSSKANEIHLFSIKQKWKGQEVVHYQNSIYGNVTVTRRGEQYNFYSDGVPVISVPTPDITFVEEFVHFPMLAHAHPEKVLIISGGAGGVINEVLKHPSVKRVDYVELDPLILEMVEKFPTALTETELKNPVVNIKHIDGRLYVKQTPCKYDVVLIGFSNPQDLQVNRFFTEEFFSEVLEKLNEQGILVVNLPGSLSYISEELKNLNACIINTLKRVFPRVRIIPGDGVNLFLASMSKDVLLFGHSQLSSRLKKRNVKVNLLIPAHIEYRLNRRWVDWFLSSTKGGTERTNRDFYPLGLFYSISRWNARFSPYMRGVFKWFEKINLQLFFAFISFFTVMFLLIYFKFKKLSRIGIPLCITTTGFSGMIFDLALIFAFQSLYGYVFYWIGLLVTAFMAGIVAGSLLMLRNLERIKKDIALFLKLEGAIIVFTVILPLLFILLSSCLKYAVAYPFLKVVFLLLCFLSGILVGAEFPLANKIYLAPRVQNKKEGLKTETGRTPNLSHSAGLLYGADLFGGWVGGIFGGVIFLPVLGIMGACAVVIMLKASSLIFLAVSSSKQA